MHSHELLMGLLNRPYDDVPDGKDEEDNVEIIAGARLRFDLLPEHYELAAVKLRDFETAVKNCQARASWCCAERSRGCTARSPSSCSITINVHGLEETNTPVLCAKKA